jgi:hypothetical protein
MVKLFIKTKLFLIKSRSTVNGRALIIMDVAETEAMAHGPLLC